MLIPMGLPKDVSVIAWGLSLERYEIKMLYYLMHHRCVKRTQNVEQI